MENLNLDLENYGLWYQPFWQTKIFYFSILILILLIFLLIFYLKKTSKKKVEDPDTMQAILEKIYLMRTNVYTENNCIEFYTELTFYLKKFLSIYFDVDITSKTEDEIIEYLKDNNLSQDFIQIIKDIVSGA